MSNDFILLVLRYYLYLKLATISFLVLTWCLTTWGMVAVNRDGLPGRRDGGGTRYTTEIQPHYETR